MRVGVHDASGNNLDSVQITLSGDTTGEFQTAGAGTVMLPALKEGAYRLRLEKQGFITLEREFTVRSGVYGQIEVVLNPAPPPPPKPAPEPPPPAAIPPGGRPMTLSVVDYLDRNLIGREPLKESILACNPRETVRLLQMREGVAQHVHQGGDEVIYVVAGEGTVRIGETAAKVFGVPAHLGEELGLSPTQVTNYLAVARGHFRQRVLDRLRAATGSEEEFQAEVRSLFGGSAP